MAQYVTQEKLPVCAYMSMDINKLLDSSKQQNVFSPSRDLLLLNCFLLTSSQLIKYKETLKKKKFFLNNLGESSFTLPPKDEGKK